MSFIFVFILLIVLFLLILLYFFLPTFSSQPSQQLLPSQQLPPQKESEFNIQLESPKLELPDFSTQPPTQVKTRKDIICTVKFNLESNQESFTCSNPEFSSGFSDKNINIISDKIIKISYSKETNSFGKDEYYYYFVLPYAFSVNFLVDLNSKSIVINTLQDLLTALDTVDSNYYNDLTSKNIQDKCLNLTRDIRGESKPPYNVACIFFPGGFNKIKGLVSLMQKSFIPALNESVKSEYYDYLVDKIKNTNTLSIFEYIVFLTLLDSFKLKNYNYVAQCNSVKQIFC